MPTLKSAKKRLRQNQKRRIRNRANHSRLKTALKHYIEALETSVEAAEKALPLYSKAIDVSARKNAIPKLRADRKKARAAMALNRVREDRPHGLSVDSHTMPKKKK